MRLTILTTVTNPFERQDRYLEAIANYCDLADKVVVVNGGEFLFGLSEKVKQIPLPWPVEWNWVEYPRHLNYGLPYCVGNWVLRLDIDQFIHENDFEKLLKLLRQVPKEYESVTMQKMSYTYGDHYYQKGSTEIIIRNLPHIKFGKLIGKETDLCFPVNQTGAEMENRDPNIFYGVPIGTPLKVFKSGISYHNYDYFFKTQESTRHQFWQSSKAYYRYFGTWPFGGTQEDAFQKFLIMIKGRYNKSPYTFKLEDHPKWIQEEVRNIKPEQCGFNLWGLGDV